MSGEAHILLLSDDPSLAEAFRAALPATPGVVIQFESEARGAIAAIRPPAPDLLVISDWPERGELLKCIEVLHGQPGLEELSVILACDADEPNRRLEAARRGVAGWISCAPDAGSVLALMHAAMRERRRRDGRSVARLDAEPRPPAIGGIGDPLVEMLAEIIELRIPGAEEHARQRIELTGWLADGFEVPFGLRGDLVVASTLCDLGRAVLPGAASSADGQSSEERAAAEAQACRMLLAKIPSLAGAAEVIGMMDENWDGTGHPSHRRQGEIPLRSRILRVAVDYLEQRERTGFTADSVVEAIEMHSGTLYDPMVVARLAAVVGGSESGNTRADRVRLPVVDLQVGMVLAQDLITDSGLKLLARATRLTPATLEVIQRRHRMEPILRGAVVVKDRAAQHLER